MKLGISRREDITVRQNPVTKKTYYRWVCSWQEGDRTVTKYLGSCEKMGEAEALEKARRMKAEALELQSTNKGLTSIYN